jgi:hypothetical protein
MAAPIRRLSGTTIERRSNQRRSQAGERFGQRTSQDSDQDSHDTQLISLTRDEIRKLFAGAAASGSTAGLVREEIQFRLPAFPGRQDSELSPALNRR